uniref:50S ribosomal protein L33, chloroplastic n=1 Tax=Rhizophora mucronata TaxID=61149 RepID=A0A2P2IJE5_RHIMU
MAGCLSMSTIQTPIRGSIICMARRYGSNTRKRMIKSRRRGGDLEKKKKRRRKVTHRKKDKFKIIRFVSEVGTGYVYAKRKGKNMKNKLEIKKYDPKVKHRVLFKETK